MAPLTVVSEPVPPEASPRESAWLVAALAAIAASVWLAARLRRWVDRRARVRRAARAQAAERDALGLLDASGFRVVGRQVRQSWGVVADRDEVRFTLIADYLVEREGKRWVAEVKTGERALDLRHGPTRRQLLEYREAFGADGVLLVDPEGWRVRSVRFFGAAPRGREGVGRRLVIGVVVGVGVGMGLGGWLARRVPAPPAAAPARFGEPAPSASPPPAVRGDPRRGGSPAHPGPRARDARGDNG